MYSPAHVWIRPLEEEGIETHPGPRFVNKNMDGLKSPGRFANFLTQCENEHRLSKVHAFLVQEHNIPDRDKHKFRAEATKRGFAWFSNHAPPGTTKTKGTGTGILVPLDMIETKTDSAGKATETQAQAIERVQKSCGGDKAGSVCSIRMLVQGKYVRVTTAYAPQESSKRASFFKNKLAPYVTRDTVLGLDANCVPEPLLDLRRDALSPYDNEGATELADIVASKGLLDACREQIGDDPFFTAHHRNRNGTITSTRIDQLYVPHRDAMMWTFSSLHRFMPPPTSSQAPIDHVAIQVELVVPKEKKGTDLKFINERIFEMPNLNHEIAAIITKHTGSDPETPISNALQTLLALTKEVREYGLKATADKAKADTAEAARMKLRINLMRARIDLGVATQSDLDALADSRTALASLKPEQRTLNDSLEEQAYTRGAAHDTGLAAMYRAITPRSPDQWVHSLKQADWSNPSKPVWADKTASPPVTKAKDIPNELVKYYSPLFSKKVCVPEAKAEALGAVGRGRKVLPPTADKCGADIRVEETLATCLHLPTGKSPGPNRIPNAFYKNFADLLAPLLTAAFNEARAGGELPDEMREGLISVLYKKGDRDDPRNYRPITLLNGDYKILMRILTERMNEAILQIASAFQNGFVPDAFIAENTHLLKLLQAYVETDADDDEGALFLFLDMEKAFDRCSWEFLHDALQELGFPDVPTVSSNGEAPTMTPHPFRQWVNLAYNHDAPPTRRMSANGYLSKPFPLASGVAQGCPLSPLLFIVFTEALSRMAEEATRQHGPNGEAPLEGVTVRGIKYYISQFADDTTLVLRPRDTPRAELLISTWCQATGGAENVGKREAVLVGALKRNASTLPDSITRGIPKEGEPIRTLGVPFGDFDIAAWYMKRYRIVKQRVAALRTLGQRSITGRNMILQSKYYGSFRYWLFSLLMPGSLIDIIEEDAKRILWASTPALDPDEVGSSQASRRYIVHLASYLKQKEGGGGVMHWESHVSAFYSQWISRYLDPRRAPWKDVLDYWIADNFHGGRTVLLEKIQDGASIATGLPPQLAYFSRCIREFEKLNVRREPAQPGPEVQAESLFNNHRFEIPLDHFSIQAWQHHLECYQIGHLFDPLTRDFYAAEKWEEYFFGMAPKHMTGEDGDLTPSAHEFADARRRELPIIIASIPPADVAIMRAEDGGSATYYALTDPDTGLLVKWVEKEVHPDGTGTLHDLWLDLSNSPHRTGATTSVATRLVPIPALVWQPDDSSDSSGDDGDDLDPKHHLEHIKALAPRKHARPRIAGPITTARPAETDWYFMPRTENDRPRTFTSLLSIKSVTKHLTKKLVGSTRPNCEKNYGLFGRLPFTVPPSVWRRIWRSLGTPLSNATEERIWRKNLHRALDVRNRHKEADTHECRNPLCTMTESQLHLVRCSYYLPFWKEILDIAFFVLGVDLRGNPQGSRLDIQITQERVIIFGLHSHKKLADTRARALIRHAWQHLYRHFTRVETDAIPFNMDVVVLHTIKAFRDAALRVAMTIRHTNTRVRHGRRPVRPPEASVLKGILVTHTDGDGRITLDPSHALTPTFAQAIANYQATVDK